MTRKMVGRFALGMTLAVMELSLAAQEPSATPGVKTPASDARPATEAVRAAAQDSSTLEKTAKETPANANTPKESPNKENAAKENAAKENAAKENAPKPSANKAPAGQQPAASDKQPAKDPAAESKPSAPEPKEPASNAPASNKPSVQIIAFSAARYEPGEWSYVGIQASNSSDNDSEGLLAIYFETDAQTQFARKLWVPAHSMRRTWLPVRIPSNINPKRDGIEMSMLLLKESPQGEILEYKDYFDLRRTSLLPADREQIKAVTLYNRPAVNPERVQSDMDDDAHRVVEKAKQLAGYSNIHMQFRDEFLPPHSLMWENLDHMILGSDRIREDSMGLVTARNWLHRGGKLWVFLDRVKIDTVAALVGDALCYEEVDRVELDEFTIGASELATPTFGDQRKFEQPVSLLRVVLNDRAQVVSRIHGWPAAFLQKVGSGEILFVTLGADGWLPAPIPPSEASRPEYSEPEYRSFHVLKSLSEHFYQRRDPEYVSTAQLQPILQEQIGYRIPARGWAALLLGANVVVLGAAGWWCTRYAALDRLIWILPAAALATTAAFLAIGRFNSRSVPPTAAYTEFVQVFPDVREASVAGKAAFYQQTTMPLAMAAPPGGLIRPVVERKDGAVTRLIWGDNDEGGWPSFSLPGGSVQFASFEQPVLLRSPIEVRAKFGAQGLEGRVAAPVSSDLHDAVIANPPALPLAIKLRGDGTFVAGRGDVLPQGRFVSETVLSDESRRHQEIYEQVLNPTDRIYFPGQATLFGWSAAFPSGMQWPSNVRQAGSAMLGIPVQLDRTPSGGEFEVPATFIETELALGKSGQSMTYNKRTGEWLKAVGVASQSRLRFVLPAEVLPCELSQAVLTVKLNAPSRSLRLQVAHDGQEELFAEVSNPSGVYPFEIKKPEQLQLDERGSMLVVLSVTESEQEREYRAQYQPEKEPPPNTGKAPEAEAGSPNSFTTWQIDYVRLDVKGKAL